MLHKINTHTGVSLILHEVPFGVKISLCEFENRDDSMTLQADGYGIVYKVDGESEWVNVSKFPLELIGVASTLNNEQVESFVESHKYGKVSMTKDLVMYKDYMFNVPNEELFDYDFPLQSWKSFLRANNIDLSKEWVVLQINNN